MKQPPTATIAVVVRGCYIWQDFFTVSALQIFINSSSFYHFHLNVKIAIIKASKEGFYVSHSDLR